MLLVWIFQQEELKDMSSEEVLGMLIKSYQKFELI